MGTGTADRGVIEAQRQGPAWSSDRLARSVGGYDGVLRDRLRSPGLRLRPDPASARVLAATALEVVWPS
jgi:hypothetical protein